jgi:hypothetical protein
MSKKMAHFDTDKVDLSLLPFDALTAVARALDYGAKKYSRFNWRKGTEWHRFESSLLRHYSAYQRGEDRDPESGELHLAHLVCNALFLLAYQISGAGVDDRFKVPKGKKS